MSGVLLLLCLFVIAQAKLECGSDSIAQIHTDDVEDHFIEIGNSFHTILLGDNRYWWHSAAIPNIGNLTFTDTWVIIGFSTQGEILNDEPAYVSSFSIEWIESLNDTYNDENKQVFAANSPLEKVYYFDEPITAKALQLTILTAVLGGPIYNYYWYLDLFGCLESEAREVFLCSNETEETSTITSTTTISSSTEASCTQPSITVTSCTCADDNPSLAANQQAVSSSLYTPTQSVDEVVESCSIQLIYTIVPSAILLVLLYITIMGWIIYAKLSKKTGSYTFPSNSLLLNLPAKTGNTLLRSLKNAGIYNKSPSADAPLTEQADSPNERDSGLAGDMVYNELYSPTSIELSQASKEDEIQPEGFYSEVDVDGVYSSVNVDNNRYVSKELTTKENDDVKSMTTNLAYMKH